MASPRLDHAVGQVAGAALGLGVADVGPRPDDAVGQDLRVLAEVRALGRADVALAEDQRCAEVALDEALEGREEVGGDQVVGVEDSGCWPKLTKTASGSGVSPDTSSNRTTVSPKSAWSSG